MLLALLLIASGGTIVRTHGSVLDATTRKPIDDVLLIFRGLSGEVTVATDASGRFEFSAPEGAYAVQILGEGYFESHRSIEVLAAGPSEFTFELPRDSGSCRWQPDVVFDHLEPERPDPVTEAYEQALRKALLQQASSTGVRLLLVPSFTAEEALWIDRGSGSADSPIVGAARMTRNLWSQMLDVLTDGHRKRSYSISDTAQAEALAKITPRIAIATAKIQSDLADKVQLVWEAMLQDARPKVGKCVTIGLDGETYHFASGKLSGETWSPEPGTKKAALVEIGTELAAFARANEQSRSSIEQRLRAEVEALLARIRADQRTEPR